LAGRAAAFSRDVATVNAYCNECVALASEHGFPNWAVYGRILQGWADAQKGEAKTGIAHIRDGLAAYEATGARVLAPLFLTLLAEALAFAGKIEEGLAALDEALAQAAVSGEGGWDAEIHRLRGELTARLPYPDPAKAEESFRTALAIAREQGTQGYELRAATSLARLWRKQGRRGEARDLLAPLYGSFTEGFDTADLKDAPNSSPSWHEAGLVMDIAAWLRGLGLERYEADFRANDIDGEVLRRLTAEDLRELGVASIGHRRRLLDAIAALGAPNLRAEPTPVAAATGEAERRQLTVMFCDLVGSTALSARFDPEELREEIRACQNAVSGVVVRYDGLVAKYMGDGVLAYFGYPRAHEDDAERVVRAGLEIEAAA
jgi:hypothetical protein